VQRPGDASERLNGNAGQHTAKPLRKPPNKRQPTVVQRHEPFSKEWKQHLGIVEGSSSFFDRRRLWQECSSIHDASFDASGVRFPEASPRRDIPRTWRPLITLIMQLLEPGKESKEKIAA
jgi:hypothetical protein